MIFNIDPTDTPFVSAIGRRDVTNVNFDWQVADLKAVDADNAQPEGFELARAAAQPTVRVANTCQILRRDATVSRTQNKANAAGKNREMAHQMAMRMKEIKRDLEAIVVRNQGRNLGQDTIGVRKTRALESWLTTNVQRGATGANATNEFSSPTDGEKRPLTEFLVTIAQQQSFASGAEPNILMVGPVNKSRAVSKFEGRSGTQVAVSENKVTSNVTVYAGDFGNLRVVTNRWQRERSAFLLDPRYAKLGVYDAFKAVPIAKIGDADTKMIVGEYGLEMSNQKAHAVIADLFDTNGEYDAT